MLGALWISCVSPWWLFSEPDMTFVLQMRDQNKGASRHQTGIAIRHTFFKITLRQPIGSGVQVSKVVAIRKLSKVFQLITQ